MKNTIEYVILSALGMSLLCGCGSNIMNVEQESQAVWEVRLAVREALCTENTDAMMELWAEDATFGQPNGELCIGKVKIRQAHDQLFEMFDDFNIEFKRLAINFPTPDVAVEDASYVFTSTGFESHGRDTTVLVKREGRWWITAVSDFIPQIPPKSITKQATVNKQDDIKAIRKLFDDFCAAHKYDDGAKLAEFYADDAILMPSDEPIVSGKVAIASRYQQDIDKFTAELTTTPDEIDVSGNLAFVRGTFTIKLTPRAGDEKIEATFKAISILRKSTDGSWKLYCDIWNSDAPLPPKGQSMPSQERSVSEDSVSLTVATVSMNVKNDTAANLKTFAKYIEQASQKGAQLIVFPEIALQQNPGWLAPKVSEEEMAYVHRTAETIPGPSTAALTELSKKYNIHIIFGMTEKSENDDLYNTSVLLEPDGVIGKYRKQHIFSDKRRGGNEEFFWKPGTEMGLFETPFGRIGIMTCIEMEDHFGGELADAGADILVTTTAWRGDKGKAVAWYDRLTRSNAFEARLWHIVSNQVGPLGYVTGYGHSRIVNPGGEVIADTGDKEGMAFETINLLLSKSHTGR